MSKHTPEPWKTCTNGTGGYSPGPADPKALEELMHGKRSPAKSAELQLANVDRCVACVNALAGIPDPAAFVSAVRAAVAAGAVEEVHLTLIRNAMEGK